jgi:hypothetical protein
MVSHTTAALAAGCLLLARCTAYCIPAQPCWPSAAEWASLNTSVDGSLRAIVPEGAPCYADINSPECAVVTDNWSNASWRSLQPGAMQDPNWEEDAEGHNCFEPWAGSCHQGDVPPYGVVVTSPAHVAAAIAFAAVHNIRLVVKSSGHEQMGRSTAPGALLVWMRHTSCIAIEHAFAACPGDTPVPAITACPGDSWGDVYEAASASGFDVVGGSARTVSAAGGYTLGGGHSWMSPFYGLAVDNVLQFTAVRACGMGRLLQCPSILRCPGLPPPPPFRGQVLANGSAVAVSPCSHPDLFWALRGGGGSSFAVVTSATYRLHAFPPAGVAGLYILVTDIPPPALAALLDYYLGFAAPLAFPAPGGVGIDGYFFVGSSSFEAVACFNASQVRGGDGCQWGGCVRSFGRLLDVLHRATAVC